VNSSGNTGDAKTDIVFVIDLNAFRRGHTHDGEPCHIIGGGPIRVDIVREVMKDAFIKAVLHDGVNVHTAKHFGRHRPAVLQTILDLGPPPDFTGASCKECGRKYNLQWITSTPSQTEGRPAQSKTAGSVATLLGTHFPDSSLTNCARCYETAL
jgi:hypothetical protein